MSAKRWFRCICPDFDGELDVLEVSPEAAAREAVPRLERAEADLDETRFCLGVAAYRDPGLIQAIREAPRD